MQLHKAVFQDRKIRRGASRRAYAQLVGITENRVHALEEGRKLKPGEYEKLFPHLGDLLDDSVPDPTEPKPEPVPEPVPAPKQPEEPEQPAYMGSDDFIAERRGLEALYLGVMNRLVGHTAPPFPWPSSHRLETAPIQDFPAIREWCQDVAHWVDSVEAGVTRMEQEEPEPEPVQEYQPTECETPPEDQIVPPAPDLTERYITNGELQTFKQCKRRWYLGSYRKLGDLEARVTGAAAIGTRVHDALAAWYQPTPGDPWATFNQIVADQTKILEESEVEQEVWAKFHDEVDLCRAMIEGYFDWVEETGADRGLRITAPEAVITANPRIPELPNARLLGKLDVRATREMDGARVFIDHKTVGDFTTPRKILHLDEQMLHYHLIEFLGLIDDGLNKELRTDGAIYNMLRKVKRTQRANPPFYDRFEVRHNLETLRSYWLRVKGTVADIMLVTRALDEGADHRQVAYPTPTKECSWRCEFFRVCPMFDDGSRAEDFLAENYVTINPLERYGDAI